MRRLPLLNESQGDKISRGDKIKFILKHQNEVPDFHEALPYTIDIGVPLDDNGYTKKELSVASNKDIDKIHFTVKDMRVS